MFTGLIEEIGTVVFRKRTSHENRLSVSCESILNDLGQGDSIAVNGVCLTVVAFSIRSFEADVSDETWKRSNLNYLKAGDSVNLERALRFGGKMGGHFVQGHVDGLGTFTHARRNGDFFDCFFSVSNDIMPSIVEKGSISINGISLTIASLEQQTFSCAVIPHTWRNTNLHKLKSGDAVNIEVDILAKYVFRLLQSSGLITGKTGSKESRMSTEFLAEHGFL